MTASSDQAKNDPRSVIVTGAARRLGREIALGLARDGWDIIVHYRGSPDAAHATVADIQALGRHAAAIQCDLAQAGQLPAFFAQAVESCDNLCGLVNNASHFSHDQPDSIEAETLQAHMAPNLAAPLVLARCLYQHLNQDARGVVVNILDQKLRKLNPDFFSYTLTKLSLQGATQMMAMQFAPQLRVVGVSPGLTLPSYLQDANSFDKAHKKSALLDHSSRPQDIVAAVVFLASQPAITGVDLTVDGGQHLMGLPRDVSYMKFE